MRKQLAGAIAAGTVLAGLVPLTAASAATSAGAARAAVHPVLTIGKAGGKAVKRGDVLTAGLAKGKSVTFFSPGTSNGVTCKSASFTDKVTKNPPSPGPAIESLTGQSFGKCRVHGVAGARSIKSIKVKGLPYRTTVSGRSGHPIVLFKARTTLTLNTVLGSLTCTYGAAKVMGTFSNTGQVNIFKDQTFSLQSGPVACPKKGNFSATFGPVTDTSVKSHPHVFVN
ncbi:MAG TPA: hypothetical protein VF843_03200 [Streptosporangiaceae bacterium]